MRKFLLLTAITAISLASCNGGGKSLPDDDSLLWKVTGNGLESPSYILGTHHFAPVAVLDNYPAYTAALESADKVVGELDMNSLAHAQALMMEEGMMPEGTTYHDIMGEEDYEKLDGLLKDFFGMGLEQFGAMKPAMISMMYTQMSYVKAQPDFNMMAHVPIDAYVQNLALETGKEVIALETVEEQVAILINSDPLDVQAKSLLCSLENDEDNMEQISQFGQMYEEGRIHEMYKTSIEDDDAPCKFSEEFEAAILKIRNDNWMKQLPGIMSEGPAFIAVGALHLPGEVGILHQLRELGYTVEPVR